MLNILLVEDSPEKMKKIKEQKEVDIQWNK